MSLAARSAARADGRRTACDGVRQAHGLLRNGHGDDPSIVHEGGALRRDAPAEADRRHPGRSSPLGHAQGGLAVGGLGIHATLAGEHEVGGTDTVREAGQLHGHVRAWDDLQGAEAVGDGEQAEDRPTGGADPWLVAQHPADGCLKDVGETAQGTVELGHLIQVGALLWPVGGGRAPLAEERVADVRGHRQVDVAKDVRDTREVHAGEVAQGTAPGRQVGPTGVQEAGPECLQDPGAAIGGGAAAHPQHDVPTAQAGRGRQTLPRPEGAGGHGVALVGRHAREP